MIFIFLIAFILDRIVDLTFSLGGDARFGIVIRLVIWIVALVLIILGVGPHD